MKATITSCSFILAVSQLLAGPAAKDPVAEGFRDFENVNAKTYVYGRSISPSSLRHRVVVVTELDATKIREQIAKIGSIMVDGMPASHIGGVWETLEQLPREVVWVVSIKNGKCDAATWREAVKMPKEHDDPLTAILTSWGGAQAAPAIYNDVKLVGYEHDEKYPYVYVLDGKSAKPVFEQAEFSKANIAKMNAAVGAAKKELGAWTPLTGVPEVQFFKAEEKTVKSLKPAKAALNSLKTGIKDKNADKATEAQMFFDAINQEHDDLKCRIMREYTQAPARAYVDAQRLFRLFPAEKKKLMVIDQALKQNKNAAALGKMFEKVVEWSMPDFTFKNASEAKKAVKTVQGWKAQIDKIANDQSNTALAGEAALIGAQIDSLADVLMTKIPQK